MSNLHTYFNPDGTRKEKEKRSNPLAGWMQSILESQAKREAEPPKLPASFVIEQDSLSYFPELNKAIFEQEKTGLLKLWFLARLIDIEGQGVIPLAKFYKYLVDNRILSLRRAKMGIEEGIGQFWKVESGDLYLYAQRRLLATFGLPQVRQAVKIPKKYITGSLKEFRAALYATFHQSRKIRSKKNTPISRFSLERATGIHRRTQQRYDLVIGIERTANYTLFKHTGSIDDLALANIQEIQGRSMGYFRFVDYKGKQQGSRAGRVYVARTLPNSYTVPGHFLTANAQKNTINDVGQCLGTILDNLMLTQGKPSHTKKQPKEKGKAEQSYNPRLYFYSYSDKGATDKGRLVYSYFNDKHQNRYGFWRIPDSGSFLSGIIGDERGVSDCWGAIHPIPPP